MWQINRLGNAKDSEPRTIFVQFEYAEKFEVFYNWLEGEKWIYTPLAWYLSVDDARQMITDIVDILNTRMDKTVNAHELRALCCLDTFKRTLATFSSEVDALTVEDHPLATHYRTLRDSLANIINNTK